jgi:predicted ribosomally synthesized peptide with SipW-like signal peptide
MKKIGVIAIALVMALGGLGAAYAGWTDQVVISGTVTTGDVDIVVEELSEREAWKDTTTDTLVWVARVIDADTGAVIHEDTPPSPGVKIAYTTADKTSDDTVTIGFVDLFACEEFLVDIKLHYAGSVPVKINNLSLVSDTAGDWVADLIALGEDTDGGIYYEVYHWDHDNHVLGAEISPEDYAQLENCDWIIVYIYVHIPQLDIYENKTTGSLTMTLDVKQWNEVP